MSAGWVETHLGARIVEAPDSLEPLGNLVRLAVRRNAARVHLLVSTVLGKHIPTDPAVVVAAGQRLADRVAAVVDPAAGPVVLGYAETATALGHVVAAGLRTDGLHSTRRAVAGVTGVIGFDEPHSHARAHLLLPEDPAPLGAVDRPLVLVDDELSTGRTALNTIAALHALAPRAHYVLAGLADLRGPHAREALADAAARLGTRIDVVALARGHVELPPELAARAEPWVGAEVPPRPAATGEPGVVHRWAGGWPAGVRDGGRHGFGPADDAAARTAAEVVAAQLAPALGGAGPTLVLGFEELMYAPLLIASALIRRGHDVRFCATTRSPVVALDEPGYPIRTALSFPAFDDPADGPGPRFAYNVAPPAGRAGWSDLVFVIDEPADTSALAAESGALAHLTEVADRVHLVVLPSYRPAGR